MVAACERQPCRGPRDVESHATDEKVHETFRARVVTAALAPSVDSKAVPLPTTTLPYSYLAYVPTGTLIVDLTWATFD